MSRVVHSGTGAVPSPEATAGTIHPELGQTVHDVNCDVVVTSGL